MQKLASDAKAAKCDAVSSVAQSALPGLLLLKSLSGEGWGIHSDWFSLLFVSSKVMKKLILEPADRLSSLQALWENNKPADPGPCGRSPCTLDSIHFNCSACCLLVINPFRCLFPLCSGGFSQMYRCVCDWLGLPYKEEVQWVGVVFPYFYVFLHTMHFLYSTTVNGVQK